jgi:hypothetical protein
MKVSILYSQQIDELGIEDIEIDVSSIEAAMDSLNKLAEMEDILKKIRYNLHIDIRKIRMEYLKKYRELEECSKKPGFLGRKKSSEKIIKKKKSLIKERDLEIKSCEIVEKVINNYLEQIEDSNAYIRDFLQNKVD